MRLATSDMIAKIDSFAKERLGIPERELMGRAGDAVARAVLRLADASSRVVIFAGKGNNGGDGYAAAVRLAGHLAVSVYDVFSAGQRSEAGNYWLGRALERGIPVYPMPSDTASALSDADIAVDAVFGTGFSGEYPDCVRALSNALNATDIKCVAIDIPIGVSADSGECETFALRADITVALSYPKVGTLSYPAREFCGELITDTLGLDIPAVADSFEFKNFLLDRELAASLLPRRGANSNKGSFGRALLVTGSDKFRGAAHLSLEAALRSGVGYVTFSADAGLCSELRMRFPEAIYTDSGSVAGLSQSAVTLIGSGSGCTEELASLTERLIVTEGAPLILDADAINAIAKYSSVNILKKKAREIILTPHPLEFSRLCGTDTDYIQSHRIACAKSFAAEYGCILLLKGAATVVTDGDTTYVNSSGSSALAKAGSGDVLAGLITSLVAQNPSDALGMCALSAYLHGAAGDALSERLSDFGVTPSDLPVQIAHTIRDLQ